MIPLVSPATIAYDTGGVPTVAARDEGALFEGMGRAVARDRPVQLDRSRRAARGRLAELLGPAYAASDAETRRFAPSDADLAAQYAKLPPRLRIAFARYADGVNAEWGARKDPWTVADSLAISARLLRTFGRGGSGELRNLALLSYLRGRSESKALALDVFDDLVPLDDPLAPTTLQPEDEPRRAVSPFPATTRADLERGVAALPALSPLDALGAARVARAELSREAAASVASPFRSGSYAVVASAARSGTGVPLLLSGPQMGFSTPSIAHEIALRGPRFSVAGMDVPGIPLVLVGTTGRRVAWGLTTGVADVEDIAALRPGAAAPPKGGEVVFRASDGTAFVRRRAYAGRELESLAALFGLYEARDARACDASLKRATMNFNAFFAAPDGVGWRYTGLVPIRAAGNDPRLPRVGGIAWRGFLKPDDLPHVLFPKSGLLSNWNTKPSRAWIMGDTPAFGRADHANTLRAALPSGAMTLGDLELAARTIATTDARALDFRPYFPPDLARWFGALDPGAPEPAAFARTMAALRRDLFAPIVGEIGGNLDAAVQDSAVLRALQGASKVPWLRGRDPRAVFAEAYARAKAGPAYAPRPVVFGPGAEMPYANRGTYLQAVELGRRFETILPPGNAESGPHALDAAPRANAWTFRPRELP